ncbi:MULTISPECIES: SGNH/GDSL hydrolase family protein [unclassified Marinobacter]|uniref:SGNH/GDSL hydrolase family protein n=1 Tax=unclassified Marinobacter TaxID=83889 RepID=UPI0026E19F3F|nr:MULTISPECIES: SGNH/GDSL hydrolase family protein [unclassified Marinobacter]MDO6441664.1 SGNH/GDSL hydrolase family protein [Marinobacter sp. 2_MG-2023]MDO6822171.1 SGNH/GDSL hydrolase family protein [Marinobacter sp. 1_MG-2023]
MLYPLSTLALAPVLIGQGRHVRRVTPRLPEPEGERQGVAGKGPELRLLILGDSAAAGVGVSNQQDALVGQLVRNLASDHRVIWSVLAETGRKAVDVLEAVKASAEDRYDVVLVSVGVNDVTGRTSTQQWLSALNELSDCLLHDLGATRVLFTAIPPMHLFPSLPQPLRWYLGMRARQLNGLMESICSRRSNLEYLCVSFPFEPGFMASDGFHPGLDAYRLWAEHSATSIRKLA